MVPLGPQKLLERTRKVTLDGVQLLITLLIIYENELLHVSKTTSMFIKRPFIEIIWMVIFILHIKTERFNFNILPAIRFLTTKWIIIRYKITKFGSASSHK